MIKINLEQSLITENKKLIMPKELLLINEYDKFTDLVENDALKRIGLNETLREGKSIKNRINQNKEQAKIFNQERVFHISQIESICKKYRLRFLSSEIYKGIIDAELPKRISIFEIAYSVKCTKYNTRIIAPMENFELQTRPKDPLLFYEINNEYFYLIHKWGNDLSLFRRILPLFENASFCMFFICLIAATSFFFVEIRLGIFTILGTFCTLLATNLICKLCEEQPITFLEPNTWNSERK